MKTESGSPSPLGPSFKGEGINIAIFSKTEPVLEVLEPQELQLKMENTGEVWHLWLPLKKISYRFIINNLRLIDPYSPEIIFRSLQYDPISHFSPETYDWEGDKNPQIKPEDLIIYEMHPRGFTESPHSGVKNPGKFLGIIEKIPYLKNLGINAIELMPIHEFNEHEVLIKSPKTGELLVNYWGYSPLSFFAISHLYQTHPNDLKDLVKACHKEGIEVILDVVFNHTAEGNKLGPTHHFKGFGNDVYYLLDEQGDYQNPTGCGNAIRASHPIPADLILAALHRFVIEFHIDGFRFDLASTFNRDLTGNPCHAGALVQAIAKDPILKKAKLIAEPWDIGYYQVGSFYPASNRFSEWNGKYRDSVRSFIRGDKGTKSEFATRICGSQDLYHKFSPTASVNFITSHDGFSLNDLVSYNHKHNIDNGENNLDGLNENISFNYGVEGPTSDPEINKLRLRQKKNFLLALLVSRGIPMLTMGDEVEHTKNGNNNTWCQDNELNWFPWEKEKTSELMPFVKKMIALRKKYFSLREDKFLTPEDIRWLSSWSNDDHFIAYELLKEGLFVAFNASRDFREVELRDENFEVLVYTGEHLKRGSTLRMEPFSSLLLKHL